MEKKQLKKLEPLWNHWYICEEGLLGEGSFGSVFKVKREEFQNIQYSACKIISIPNSQGEISQLESTGMTKEQIEKYYETVVQEIYNEIVCMSQLKGKSTIVNYEDHEIRKRKDGIGYYILIRMELAESLTSYTRQKELATEEIIKMGKDLCQALIICEKNHILHRDIKPDNIFVSKDGEFKLGDFGIARIAKEYQIGLSVKGSYEYMAPEVYSGKKYDHRVDIYSLGVVLYTYLNQKRIPFIKEKQENITYQHRQQALQKRLSGEPVLPIPGIPVMLGEAIYKAVAFEPLERYSNATEFYDALVLAEKEQMEQKECVYNLPKDLDATVVIDFGKTAQRESQVEEFLGLAKEILSAKEPGKKDVKKGKERKDTHLYNLKKRHVWAAFQIIMPLIVFVCFFQLKDTEEEFFGTRQNIGDKVVVEQVLNGLPVAINVQGNLSHVLQKETEPTITPVAEAGNLKKKKKRKEKIAKVPEATEIPKVMYTAVTKKDDSEEKKATPAPVYAQKMDLPSGISMRAGGTVSLPLVCTPKQALITVCSGDETVVQVKDNVLYAKKAGVSVIVVSSGNCRVTCTIYVTED